MQFCSSRETNNVTKVSKLTTWQTSPSSILISALADISGQCVKQMPSFQQILHYLYVLFFKEQAFLVSNDRDVVSYILNASQGESKHHITKWKQIFLSAGGLIWHWSHTGPSRWSGLTANKFVILDHPLPQQAGPSTWSWFFVKNCHNAQCVLCTVRCPCIQNAPGYYMYICVYDTGAY